VIRNHDSLFVQIEKRSKLGESQTLQQFSRDADEIENWMLEKLQLAEEETYKDPANIQSKHQKHQAFEAELGANADRIQSVLAMGQNLVSATSFALFIFGENIGSLDFKLSYFSTDNKSKHFF
jgi:hypothetical protein